MHDSTRATWLTASLGLKFKITKSVDAEQADAELHRDGVTVVEHGHVRMRIRPVQQVLVQPASALLVAENSKHWICKTGGP